MTLDRTTHSLAIANLVAQIGIIVTGGLVRLTGSGLGCSQWPLCEPGQFTPQFREESSIHPYIEFGNRTLTGVLTIIAVLLLIAVYRREPTKSRPSMKRLAWWPLIGIIAQAIIGGITVWVDLHPAIVGLHMLISLSLVAVSAYILWRLPRQDTAPSPLLPQSQILSYSVSLSAALLVILGTVVTGAGPHSGDATEPYRWGMDTVMVSRVHALSAWLFTAIAIAGLVLILRHRKMNPSADADVAVTAWSGVLVVAALNGLIGYVQHATNLPEPLVLAHMFGAALLVASVAYAASALYPRTRATSGPAVTPTTAAARR